MEKYTIFFILAAIVFIFYKRYRKRECNRYMNGLVNGEKMHIRHKRIIAEKYIRKWKKR